MSNDLPQIDLTASHDLEGCVARGIDELFKVGASDITIQTGDFIWAYVNRQHVQVTQRRLDGSEIARLIRNFYPGGGAEGILGSGVAIDTEVDLRPDTANPDYSLRCRANITRCRVGDVTNAVSITLRTIPGLPPQLEALNLPQSILENIIFSQGLALIVGITGSGKSTLLAAINRKRLEGTRPDKIITIEDPIEFTYTRLPVTAGERARARMPEVSQVQVGTHLKTFDLAVPNILRRKADVIVMGEMRDRASVESGLLLADTGHATYATAHSRTPAEALARVIAEFPFDAQPSVATRLLDALRIIVAQKIERDTKGRGMAFRCWCIFDQQLKATLFQRPFAEWSAMVRDHMKALGQDFASQALPALRDGVIDVNAFSRLADFNPAEAREYLAARGLDDEGKALRVAPTEENA